MPQVTQDVSFLNDEALKESHYAAGPGLFEPLWYEDGQPLIPQLKLYPWDQRTLGQ